MKKTLWAIILILVSLNGYAQEIHNVNFTLDDVLWIKDKEVHLQSKESTTLKYYKIAFHIVRTSSGTGGIEEPKIYKAVAFMNEKYIGANVQFYLCEISYIDSDTYYDFQMSTEDNLMQTYNIPDAINVYLFNTMAYGSEAWWGYTYLPSGNRNIIALRNSTMENLSTITHEFGHFFGLPHTHNDFDVSRNEYVDGSNCEIAGDFFCDTPADPRLSFADDVNESCVYIGGRVDAHGDAYNPATDLIMSFARHNCRTRFSLEQLNSINYWANQSIRTSFSHMYVLENITLSSDQTISEDVIALRSVKIVNNSKIILKPCAIVEISGDSEMSLGATLDIE